MRVAAASIAESRPETSSRSSAGTAYSPAAMSRSRAIIWPRIGPVSILTAASMRSILRASAWRPDSSLVSSAAAASDTSGIRRLRRNASSIRFARSPASTASARSDGSTSSASRTLAAACACSGRAMSTLWTKLPAASDSPGRAVPAAGASPPSCASAGTAATKAAVRAKGSTSCGRIGRCTSMPLGFLGPWPGSATGVGSVGYAPGTGRDALKGAKSTPPEDPVSKKVPGRTGGESVQ